MGRKVKGRCGGFHWNNKAYSTIRYPRHKARVADKTARRASFGRHTCPYQLPRLPAGTCGYVRGVYRTVENRSADHTKAILGASRSLAPKVLHHPRGWQTTSGRIWRREPATIHNSNAGEVHGQGCLPKDHLECHRNNLDDPHNSTELGLQLRTDRHEEAAPATTRCRV